MLFVGDDWAEDHHDVHLMDETGTQIARRRLPEGLAGIRGFHELIADHADEPGDVVVGIETDRGLWVQALIAAGYQLYAINPLAAARYRDRHNVAGAKSDAGDAKVLADLVRTDRHNHRPVAGDSNEADAIKVLARGHQNLIWSRNRQTNSLRSALREYYPAALLAFDDLAHSDCLAVLAKAPTPTVGARLSIGQIGAALKRGGRQRNIERRANEIRSALRPTSSPLRNRSRPRSQPRPSPRSGSFPSSTARSRSSSSHSPTILNSTRTPTSTVPCQDLVSSSAPGRSASSGTTPTVTPARSLARITPARHLSRSRRARSVPCSPVTFATNGSTTRSTSGRSAP